MTQPSDVTPRSPGPSSPRLQDASDQHRLLFQTYVAEFQKLYPELSRIWDREIETGVTRGLEREQAVAAAHERALAGPAAHPRLIALVRWYWLQCHALNREVGAHAGVPPEQLLLGWLIEVGKSDLVQLIACLPYWPIGLDENGNWC